MIPSTIVYVSAMALLTRLDGWDKPKTLEWLSIWPCGALALLFTLVYTQNIGAAAIVGPGWVLWRAVGFGKWENWAGMFFRGALTSFVTFIALSWYISDDATGLWWVIPMGIAEMLFYTVPYHYLSYKFPRQHIAEIGTGLAFSLCVAAIL